MSEPRAAPNLDRALELARATAWRLRPQGYDIEEGDILSAAYEGALKAHRSFDPQQGASYDAWVIFLARCAVKDEYRAMQRQTLGAERRHLSEEEVRMRIPIPLSALEEYEHPAAPDPTEPVPQRVALAEAIHTLPDPHRAALVLFYFEGWTLDEIGVRFERSGSCIGNWIESAREFLRYRLTDGDPFDRRALKGERRMRRSRYGPYRALTTEEVKQIRTMPGTYGKIGERYGVGSSTIGRIKRRQAYREIE